MLTFYLLDFPSFIIPVDENSFKEYTARMDSSEGYFLYFVLNLVAACKVSMITVLSNAYHILSFAAFPKILFVAAFLLLLSFWVDLCHEANDDDEDEGCSYREALLEKLNTSDPNVNDRRSCCSFRSIPIGSRQKIVILVTVIVFAIMIACSVLIWVGMRKSPINPAIVAEASILWLFAFHYYIALRAHSVVLLLNCGSNGYVCINLAMVKILILPGDNTFNKLAIFYHLVGLMLFLKMRKVRSDRASSEMRKVAGLAIVSVLSFASSASVAIGTNIPQPMGSDGPLQQVCRTRFQELAPYEKLSSGNLRKARRKLVLESSQECSRKTTSARPHLHSYCS
ncbi:UNVERIFIED_CONTAM: hypothetical protein Slati_1977500 [Sesamum latifolium]|uniref:Uncharacterized protein n=1 Tax=Sesamum latifolium TaxID=2727402 RepID=A0AAW2WMF2_9LAMI